MHINRLHFVRKFKWTSTETKAPLLSDQFNFALTKELIASFRLFWWKYKYTFNICNFSTRSCVISETWSWKELNLPQRDNRFDPFENVPFAIKHLKVKNSRYSVFSVFAFKLFIKQIVPVDAESKRNIVRLRIVSEYRRRKGVCENSANV